MRGPLRSRACRVNPVLRVHAPCSVSMRRRYSMRERVCALALGAAVLVGCTVAHADQTTDKSKAGKSAKDDKTKIDPKADELLRKMTDYLAATKSFQFDADHVLEVVTEEGETLQF